MSSSVGTSGDLGERARGCLKRRDYQSACELFTQLVAQEPDCASAHEGLAGSCFALRDYERAIRHFKRAAALMPRRVEPLVNLGAVYNRMGNYSDAVKILRQALSKDRKCAAAYFNLGFAQRHTNQKSMAVAAYKEAIKLAPEMIDAYLNLGQVLADQGNLPQARAQFEKALQLKPNHEKARQSLAGITEQVAESKRQAKPFGRLVDVDQLNQQSHDFHRRYRKLSDEERTLDRNQLHQLSKEAEHAAAAAIHQLRTGLSPALLGMARVVTDTENPRAWVHEADQLKQAINDFAEFRSHLERKVNDLSTHEAAIRQP